MGCQESKKNGMEKQDNQSLISIEDFSENYRFTQKNGIWVHQTLSSYMDMKIYKYMRFEHLLELLQSKNMYIANRKSFNDARETGRKENIKYAFSDFTPAKMTESKREQYRKIFAKKYSAYQLCVSCWTKDVHDKCDESITNWKCYGMDACRIQTTIGDLLDSMSLESFDFEALLAPVEYENETFDFTIEQRIFRKHIAYQDEQEIRLCLLTTAHHVEIPINLERLIHAIRLSPFFSKFRNRMIHDSLINRYPILERKIEYSHILEAK